MGDRFDPRACADLLRDRPLIRRGKGFVEPPEEYFCGSWDELHPLNVPGPFYGGGTDTCADGPPLAPDNLLFDDGAVGFVYRQPATRRRRRTS